MWGGGLRPCLKEGFRHVGLRIADVLIYGVLLDFLALFFFAGGYMIVEAREGALLGVDLRDEHSTAARVGRQSEPNAGLRV